MPPRLIHSSPNIKRIDSDLHAIVPLLYLATCPLLGIAWMRLTRYLLDEYFQFGAMLMTPQEFAAKWRGATLKERAAAQEHFLDLCHMMGHKTPADVDPTGEFFTFEKGAEKLGGQQGFADVWYKDHFAWEYKTRHKNLAEAYKQLLLYRDNLNNPPLLVVCDFERFEVRTNFTNTPTHLHQWTNDEIVKPENLRVLRALFSDPEILRPQKTLAQVTEEAAADFARLAPMLTARGVEPHEAAHFLIRALFCLFAEDIGLLPNDLFTRVVTNSLDKPGTFRARIEGLFYAMAEGEVFGADNLPYFNGGLFADSRGLALEKTELEILRTATRREWANVDPAIFGTLFERSLDPSKRPPVGRALHQPCGHPAHRRAGCDGSPAREVADRPANSGCPLPKAG